MIALLITIGCKRIESIQNQKTPRSGTAPASSLPTGALVIDVNGQAIAPRNSEPDDRVRTAAILDALRNFSLESQNKSTSGVTSDTVIAIRNWDGIDILGVTIRHAGVVLLDSVVVSVVNFKNENPIKMRWKSINMTLVEPDSLKNLKFDDLIGSLNARGIEVKIGLPKGLGIWQETLSIRRWGNR